MQYAKAMNIGQNIKQRRKSLRMSQTELAGKSGVVTQTMISRIESGEDNMTLSTLRGIAAALGCSVVDLLDEEDKKRSPQRIKASA
jgi:transcriptional regulator with XRE-family HTH domain